MFRRSLLRNRMLQRPTWGALIRVSAPIAGSQEEAAQASEDLLREIHPGLRGELKTWEQPGWHRAPAENESRRPEWRPPLHP